MRSEVFRDDLAARAALRADVPWERSAMPHVIHSNCVVKSDAEAAAKFFGVDYGIEVSPATPEQRAARVSDLVTITVDMRPWADDIPAMVLQSLYDFQRILPSDVPGIKSASAAKALQPAPEPILSLGGEVFDTAELLEACRLVRAKRAAIAAASATPRRLLIVAPIDHRFGRWQEV